MDKAKELLRGTSMPINAVAMEVGYDNFAYFAKVFRGKEGMSPNEYRKNVKVSEKRKEGIYSGSRKAGTHAIDD